MDELFIDFRQGDKILIDAHCSVVFGIHIVEKVEPNGWIRVEGQEECSHPEYCKLLERPISGEEMDYVRKLQDLFDGVIFQKEEDDLVEYKFRAKDTHLS